QWAADLEAHRDAQGQTEDRILVRCELGHLALMGGDIVAARAHSDGVRRAVAELGMLDRSLVAQTAQQLERSVEAFETGAHVYRGESLAGLSEPLRKLALGG